MLCSKEWQVEALPNRTNSLSISKLNLVLYKLVRQTIFLAYLDSLRANYRLKIFLYFALSFLIFIKQYRARIESARNLSYN